jgi:antitoxin (DNA-binding transcriptional repressor) of toxin-antitoxin stability system
MEAHMAVIMMDVQEAASRLDEMVDATLAGEQVVVTRDDQPVGMLVPFEGPGRPGGAAGPFGARGGAGVPPDEAPSGFDREVIIVRRQVRIVACML